MRKPHRKAHFIVWIVLAPMVIIGGVFALSLAPSTPYATLPGLIEGGE